MNINIPRSKGQDTLGFNRVELVVVVVVLIVLAGLTVAYFDNFHHSKEAQCASNLKALGVAMALYEKDNDDRLPYAFIQYDKTHFQVWDSLIFHYVPPGANGFVQKHLLLCPLDTILARGGALRRTYAMPAHSMDAADWPLASDNATGVGIWWDDSRATRKAYLTNYISVTKTQGEEANAGSVTVTIPAINLSMIQAPASTLLLTERAEAGNIAFSYSGATIHNPSQHFDTKAINADQYQGGKVNYLMVDGHVELMYPLNSLGQHDLREGDSDKQYPNIWTIRSDD
jgi:prepilin-type processing-associated H-X9-DG protein